MKTSAVSEWIERAEAPVVTFGDVVQAVSQLGDPDAAELLNELLASGRVRFVDPGAAEQLFSLSSRLRRVQRLPGQARRRSARARRASRVH